MSQAARETIRRRGARAPLRSRATATQRRFDEGGRTIDAFVRGHIGFDAGAMNLFTPRSRRRIRGRIRVAGQEAFHGRARSPISPRRRRRAATEEVFAVRERRANGEAAPLVAAMFDQRMISIHPVRTRTAAPRALMTDWLLAREGFPPALPTAAALSSVLLWENPASRATRTSKARHRGCAAPSTSSKPLAEPRLFATGFGPFPGAPVNPTAWLAEDLRGWRPSFELVTHVLEVTYDVQGAFRSRSSSRSIAPDAVVAFA